MMNTAHAALPVAPLTPDWDESHPDLSLSWDILLHDLTLDPTLVSFDASIHRTHGKPCYDVYYTHTLQSALTKYTTLKCMGSHVWCQDISCGNRTPWRLTRGAMDGGEHTGGPVMERGPGGVQLWHVDCRSQGTHNLQLHPYTDCPPTHSRYTSRCGLLTSPAPPKLFPDWSGSICTM